MSPRARTTSIAIGAASVLLAAACSSSDSASPGSSSAATASASASASGTAPQTPPPTLTPEPTATDAGGHQTVAPTGTAGPLESALLVNGEVPGFAMTSKGDLEQAAAQVDAAAAAAAAMTVQPANCDAFLKSVISGAATIYKAISVGAVQGFTSPTGQQLAEAVVGPADASGYLIDTAQAGQCSDLTVVTGPTQASVTVAALPLSLGDSSSGAFVTQTINAGGTEIKTVTAVASITKHGSVVALSLTGAADDPAALQAMFVEVVTKAYQKAEPAL